MHTSCPPTTTAGFPGRPVPSPLRAPTAPAHRPLHAHQHVGQIFHLEVHQGEQRWADCKGEEGGQEQQGWAAKQERPREWGSEALLPRECPCYRVPVPSRYPTPCHPRVFCRPGPGSQPQAGLPTDCPVL